MFNRRGFNSELFNRTDTVGTEIFVQVGGSGTASARVVMRINLSSQMNGNGGITTKMSMQTPLPFENGGFSGSGSVALTNLVYFFLHVNPQLSGNSEIACALAIQTPLEISLDGSGDMLVAEKVYQQMSASLSGSSDLATTMVMARFLELAPFSGTGGMGVSTVNLPLSLIMPFIGSGTATLRRLSELNEVAIELDGINLLPGKELIIDSELLNVYIDGVYDVSALTNESDFIEFEPGEQEIKIEMSPSQSIHATLIVSNRWL